MEQGVRVQSVVVVQVAAGVVVGTVPPAQTCGVQAGTCVGKMFMLLGLQAVQVVVVVVVQVVVHMGVVQRTLVEVHTPTTTPTHAAKYVSTHLLATSGGSRTWSP